MRRGILLRLDDDGLSAWSWRPRRLQALADFPDDARGHAAFADFLAQRRGESYALLADLADEMLQTVEIPRLGRRDRAALIARRLARHFPETPLRCATPAGRAPAGGDSEILLLHALPSPQRLAPWLTALAGIDLGRLHTAGQFAAPLLAQLAPGEATALLVVCHARRLRITCLAAGHPRFSRLLPQRDDLPGAIADEAERLLRYLLEQRLHQRGRPLPVCVLAPAALLAELSRRWPAGGELALRPVAAADSRAFELQLLARRPPPTGIPLGHPRRMPIAAWLDRLLVAGGATALAGALAFAGSRLQLARQMDAETRDFNGERAQLAARLAMVPAISAAPPLDAAGLRRLDEVRARLERRRQAPAPAFHRLSRLLDTLPAIGIERLDWKIQPVPGTSGDGTAPLFESLTVHGRQHGTREDFAELLAGLRRDPGATLSILRTPDTDGNPPSAAFTVEIRGNLAP